MNIHAILCCVKILNTCNKSATLYAEMAREQLLNFKWPLTHSTQLVKRQTQAKEIKNKK